MVDVATKTMTHRFAKATGSISMLAHTFEMISRGDAKKGDVLGVARIAGIQGAKKTSDLIPLCHPISLTHLTLDFELIAATATELPFIRCVAAAETIGPTGVEMEALTAVQTALLTVYDMCKAVDRGMVISNVRLLEKRGGKSGNFTTDF